MKLAFALLMVVAVTSAVEDSEDQMVKICGDDLIKAFQQACEQKSVEYLLEHGLYDPELELDHKHQHSDHHRRDHDHSHDHDHDHNHDHGHNKTHDRGHDHDHAHNHDHRIHHLDNHSNSEKKGNENDRSIAEACCYKPCLVKDFVSYCG